MNTNLATTWSAQEIATALHTVCSGNWVSNGISKDSRTLQPGNVFIALQGPNTDGHHHLEAAFAAGAMGVIVSALPASLSKDDPRIILVPDTLQALHDLATAARARTQAQLIAITGSFGKTSTKDILASLLAAFGKVYASERSFNNHWGVPFTLANLPTDVVFGVIEIGMNHQGEIAPLAQLVSPHIALITTVRAMHMENLGSLENIANEKADIFANMQSNGVAIVNHDDTTFERVVNRARERGLAIITFGKHPLANFCLIDYTTTAMGTHIKADIHGKPFEYSLPVVIGEHWVVNSLAMLAVIHALGIDIQQAASGFSNMVLPEGRGMRHQVPVTGGEIIVIDESYNAGPDSMRAAITVLGAMQPTANGRRIAILGDMREIGEQSAAKHASLTQDLVANNIHCVFTCGKEMTHLYNTLPQDMQISHKLQAVDLIPELRDFVRAGDICMIKGSKGQYADRGHMYALVEALLHLKE